MCLVIQSGEVLAIFSVTNDDLSTLYVAKVKCVHGMTGFQHDVVRDVYDVIDGTHTGGTQTLLHPVGRFLNTQILNNATHIARTQVIVIYADGDVVVNIATNFGIRGDRCLKLFTQCYGCLAGNAQYAVAIRAVSGNLKIDQVIIQLEYFPHIGAGRIRVIHNHNAVNAGVGEIALF